jgi:ferrous iron transport protein B
MRLSELKTNQKGVITKVMGHGSFRKRIVEMGFIRGKTVEVILNAPLKDPVKYKIMDYEVSLRRSEARTIEVVSEEEAKKWADAQAEDQKSIVCDDVLIHKAAEERGKTINVALVGNPNCGKTCIFNIASGAHERVGNYSGVTVDEKEGHFKMDGYTFNITDLPGTYSLSAYSPEELYVRKHIIDKTPDVIINVVDASNIERNLYLTTQLIDMDVKMVVALNMYDELKSSGNKLDYKQLGLMLGVPFIPTVGRTGEGVKQLFKEVIAIYNEKESCYRHIHVNHGKEIENEIDTLRNTICSATELGDTLSTRFLAIKLLENDKQMERTVSEAKQGMIVVRTRDRQEERYKKTNKEGLESAITDAKYGFIQGALREVLVENKSEKRTITKSIDAIVTHKIWGFPLFFLFMYIMFYVTFNVGQYPMDWIDSLVQWLSGLVGNYMPEGPLKGLISDGIINGVGGVIVFLPNIMILYAFISFMEDSGYMARAAFIMDRIMHKMGLHGKSFIPMVMGFGCNIPAIMATRTIEDHKSRLITMLIIPLMSCSARLPIYMILIAAFFPSNAALILLGLYMLGILVSIIMAKLFSKFFVKGESSPFVMELPPYRMPTGKAVCRHTWEKGKQYLKKMGTVILLASIIVWFLSYYPNHDKYSNVAEQQENSYIGKMGKAIEPVIKPCGFDWKQGVSIIAGTAAKEIVASTMGVLYSSETDAAQYKDADLDDAGTSSRLSAVIAKHITPLSAIAFMVFVLLYMPCIPGIVTIKGESGRWKWAGFVVAYTTILAWISSFVIYQIGSIII